MAKKKTDEKMTETMTIRCAPHHIEWIDLLRRQEKGPDIPSRADLVRRWIEDKIKRAGGGA